MTTRDPVMIEPIDDSDMGVTYSGTGNKQIDDIVSFIKDNFPDIDLAGNGMSAEERAAAWAQELESGSGRSYEELRADIFTHVVGEEKVKDWVTTQFNSRGITIATGTETEADRIGRITDSLISGERTFFELKNTLDGFAPVNPDYDPNADPNAPDDAILPQGETAQYPGVLAGGQTVRISRTNQEDIYAQVYEYPPGSGNFFSWQWDNEDAMRAALGPNASVTLKTEDWYNANADVAGNGSEVIGLTGGFTEMVEDIKATALRRAGINDPTITGQFLADPAISDLIVRGAVADWTEAQMLAEIRQTAFYTEVLYPGIDNFYGRTDDPETAYAIYQQNVASNLNALGISKDPDGTYKSTIADLLDSGVDDTDLATFTPTYLRAAGNDTYRQNLNQWLTAAGMSTIDDFDSFFDVIGGQAAPDVQEVVELAGLSTNAELMGIEITNEIFKDIAASTDLTEGQMVDMFTDVDRALVALGDSGLAQYDIGVADILQAKAGLAVEGKTPEQTNALINKIIKEQALSDDPTAQFYTGFTREGAPFKQGLGANVAEGA